MAKWWKVAIPSFALGALLCGGVVLWLAHGAGAKLNADLNAANDSADSLRTSLADAVASNHSLADQVQSLSGRLDRANRILAADDAVIARQQRDIAAGQRIIDGIVGNIASTGRDLERDLTAIADGFGRLYSLYHPNQAGSTKGSR